MVGNGGERIDLIGREHEKRKLRDVVERVERGHGSAAAIVGPDGVGKSALLTTAARIAQHTFAGADEAVVAMATATEAERNWPYAGLQLVLSSVVGAMGPKHLARMEPELSRLAAGLDATVDPRRVAVPLAARLSLIEAPAIVLIDDAHLLDLASQEVIGFLARRMDPYPIGIVLAGLDTDPPAPVLDGVTTILLDDLTPEHAVQLIRGRFRDVAEPVAAEIVRRLGGHPRTVIETTTELSGSQRQGQARLDRYLPVPASVRGRLVRRVDMLTPEQRFALVVAAVSEDRRVHPLVDALGGPGEEVTRWLSQEHLEVADGYFRLRSPLLGSIVWHDAGPVELTRAHTLLADAYRDLDPETAWWHEAQARLDSDDVIAEALERVARQLLGRGEFERSAAFARESVRLTTKPSPRVRRTLLAGGLAVFAGHYDEAIHLARERIRSGVPDPHGAVLALLESRARLAQSGEVPTDLIVRHAERLEHSVPDLAAQFWLVGVRGHADRAEIDQAAGYLARARTCLSGAAADTRNAYYRMAAWTSALRGRFDEVTELLSHDVDGSDVLIEADRCLRRAMIFTRLERFDDARRLLRVITEERRFGETSAVLGHAYVVAMVVDMRAGRLEAARRAANAWQRIIGAERATRGAVPAYMVRVHALMGNWRAAEECRVAAWRVARQGGDTWTSAVVHAGAGAMDLLFGRPQDAISELERARELALRHDDPSLLLVEPDFIEACVQVGVVDRARDALAVFNRRVDAVPTSWGRHTLARCRALVAGVEADEMTEELYSAAVSVCADDVSPVELARTQLHYGHWLRRAGRRTEGDGWLQRAAALIAETGAAQLAVPGELPIAARAAPAGDGPELNGMTALTNSERRIVELVAEGRRNREIAVELYISVRTVESHLGRAFRKLGVRSRAELARMIANQRRGSTVELP